MPSPWRQKYNTGGKKTIILCLILLSEDVTKIKAILPWIELFLHQRCAARAEGWDETALFSAFWEALWRWFHFIPRLHLSLGKHNLHLGCSVPQPCDPVVWWQLLTRPSVCRSLNSAVTYILTYYTISILNSPDKSRQVLFYLVFPLNNGQSSEVRGHFPMRPVLAHERHGSPWRTWFDPVPSEWADHHLPLGQKLQRIPGIPTLQLQRRGEERTSHRSRAAWEKTPSPGKELYRLSARDTCAILKRVLL